MALTKRNVLWPLILLATTVSTLLIVARSREVTTPANAASTLPHQPSPAPVTLGNPTLAREIDRLIDEGRLAQARWGVVVKSLADGRLLYSRNGDKLFTPASNMKIYTTAVALDLLGADYRWRTSVYAGKQVDASGTLEGDLILYGRGAPDVDSFRKDGLPALALQLAEQGLRRVRGKVVGDESYFRGEMFGLGWQWNDLQWYFGAAPSALSVDQNSVALKIFPATKPGSAPALILDHEGDYLRLINNTTTVARGEATTIGINRGLSGNELRVWGEFPLGARPFSAYLSVPNPALWAATLFKQALVTRGITVDGESSSRDFRVAEKDRFDPQKAFEMAHLDSESLGEIIHRTNKESNNLYAELILRTLGKERGATAPDPDPRKNRQRGDDEAGLAVIKLWLSQHQISTVGLELSDGCGLSRLDLVTPEATAEVLESIAKTNSAAIFHDSLPVAGRDGTLSSRLRGEAGRVYAKTGSLTYDHSLSGYAITQSGEVLVFAIFCNDATAHADPVRVIDQIAALLAGLESAQLTITTP